MARRSARRALRESLLPSTEPMHRPSLPSRAYLPSRGHAALLHPSRQPASHLTVCRGATATADDLRATRSEIASSSQRDEHQGAPSAASAPDVPSRLQGLLDKSQSYQRAMAKQKQENPRTQPRARKWIQRRRHVIITEQRGAGVLAGALAGILRNYTCADVSYTSILTIVKCLKVLALTNIFLSSHGHTCSFVFSKVSAAIHQERIQGLMADARDQFRPERRGRAAGGPPEGQGQPGPAGRWEGGASTSGRQHGEAPVTPESGGLEPLPELPRTAFRLHTWTEQCPELPAEVFTSAQVAAQYGVQRLDFSLDLRQPWRRVAYISYDTAMGIADTLFKQLHAQLSTASAGAPQEPLPADSRATERAVRRVRAEAKKGQRVPERDAGAANVVPAAPTMLYDTDLTQAVLMFTALCFVQQRLTNEGSDYMLAVSVLRHPQWAQRADGRNGFLLKLQLVPQQEVWSHMRWKLAAKKRVEEAEIHAVPQPEGSQLAPASETPEPSKSLRVRRPRKAQDAKRV